MQQILWALFCNCIFGKINKQKLAKQTSAHSVVYPGILFRGGLQQIQLRTVDRENGDLGGGSPLVKGSGGSCNLLQEISFHIVRFS